LIRAIFFDLDETLLDRDASVELYLKGQYSRIGLDHIPYQVYRDHFMELDTHGYADRQQVFQALATEFALPVSAAELVNDFRQNAWKICVTFPDAREVLEQLRARGYRLGIITNGSEKSQRAKLLASGLLDLVDVALISEEEKIRKPDPEIFVRAAERLSVTATECVFVGDNPQTDIGGAHNAGMNTVWVKGHLPWPTDLAVLPDHIVRDLLELLTIEF
jgi:putative hydrolase of the HAD superfamily